MRHQTVRISLSCALLSILFVLAGLASCSSIKILMAGGEKQVKHHPRPVEPGPYVLIFAFDGAGYDQLMAAINSGKAPRMAAMLGKSEGGGLYEHAYSAPNAVSILPSTTVAAWSAIFTGAPPAQNGVTGNEWFVRQEMKFYAPVPVSVEEMDDNRAMITDDLVGHQLKVPTLFQQAGVKSAVSLNMVYRGADYFTLVDPTSMVEMFTEFVSGKEKHSSGKRDVYQQFDEDSVPKLLDSIEAHGVPKIQVVYFPGIDLYTHLAPDALPMEIEYLENVTDPLVGKILDAYRNYGVLDQTYVMVIADHGHTPVLKDPQHALGAQSSAAPTQVLQAAGFRPRKLVLNPGKDEQDYQAVFAYQGAIAYVYLADRSTCPNPGDVCNWKLPPRYKQDVLPVARAFYYSSKHGRPVKDMKGTLDLVFAREPVTPGEVTREYKIFDGERLEPIWEYLLLHRRDDLVQLNRRMRWLSAGPYGDRAGDVLLLSVTGLDHPIQNRYYFSAPYHSWHGSASMQDSHIPLIVARDNYPSIKLKKLVDAIGGDEPSQLALVPIVRSLLVSEPPKAPAVPGTDQGGSPSSGAAATQPGPGSDQSKTPAAKSQ